MGVTSYLTVNGEILSETRSGVESDYIPDPQGSTAALTNSSQTITDTFTWWPYGEERTHTGSSLTPFGYLGTLGYYADDASGRVYVRANILLPNQTRWLSVDRIRPSMRPYAYVRARPTVMVDPSGLQHVTNRSAPIDRLVLAVEDDCIAVAGLLFATTGAAPDPGILASYNACVAGSGCPPLSQSILSCLADQLCNMNSNIVLTTNEPGGNLCGTSWTPWFGCPQIRIYTDNDWRCNHNGANAQYHIVLIHEALHNCGVDHGPGKSRPETKCNNIMACCMLRATGYLSKSQHCGPKALKP